MKILNIKKHAKALVAVAFVGLGIAGTAGFSYGQDVDSLAKKVTGNEVINTEVGSRADIKTVLGLKDTIYSKVKIDDSAVNYVKLGTYKAKIDEERLIGKQASKTVTVKVQDTQAPTILLNKKAHTLNYGASVDAKEFVNFKDNYTYGLKLRTSATSTKINTQKVGKTTATITTKDEAGNKASKTLVFTVKDDIKPKIKGINAKVLSYGASFKALDGVEVSDNSGSKPSLSIRYNGNKWSAKNRFSTKKAGNYKIVYVVVDGSGNKTRVERSIKVKAKPAPVVKAQPTQAVYNNTIKTQQPANNAVKSTQSAYKASNTSTGYNSTSSQKIAYSAPQRAYTAPQPSGLNVNSANGWWSVAGWSNRMFHHSYAGEALAGVGSGSRVYYNGGTYVVDYVTVVYAGGYKGCPAGKSNHTVAGNVDMTASFESADLTLQTCEDNGYSKIRVAVCHAVSGVARQQVANQPSAIEVSDPE